MPLNESTGPISPPPKIPPGPGGAALGALGAMIATLVALAAIVVIGILSWPAVRGLQGVYISGALGAAAGASLKGRGAWMARVLGGAIGGGVAGFFAVSAAEAFPPGSMRWALGGGAFAALFALPVAALVGGLIGMLIRTGLRHPGQG